MYKSKEVLKSLSKIAADNYLSNPKSSLKSELVKVASQESLAPVQIPFYVAEANQQVWKTLYDMDKKASYGFTPTDPKEIVDSLQVEKTPVIKQASEDYFRSPKSTRAVETLNCEVQTYGLNKTASERRELKQTLQYRLEKLSLASEQLRDKEMVLTSAIESAENSIVKQARQLLLDLPFSDRGDGMDKVAEFVRAAMLPKKKSKEAARLIAKIAYVLKSQGLVKAAELKAPEEYISEKLPARVINGNHSLYMTINTLVHKWDEKEQVRQGREIVDSSLPELKEKVREL